MSITNQPDVFAKRIAQALLSQSTLGGGIFPLPNDEEFMAPIGPQYREDDMRWVDGLDEKKLSTFDYHSSQGFFVMRALHTEDRLGAVELRYMRVEPTVQGRAQVSLKSIDPPYPLFNLPKIAMCQDSTVVFRGTEWKAWSSRKLTSGVFTSYPQIEGAEDSLDLSPLTKRNVTIAGNDARFQGGVLDCLVNAIRVVGPQSLTIEFH